MNFLVIGLGNPGEEYTHTRHNIGRMAVEAFANSMEIDSWKADSKAQSLTTSGSLSKKSVVCVLPDTFMNKSGVAAAYLSKIKKVKPENIVIVHDDMDLPVGTIKISFGRGSGGHNGIESIIKHLKTRDFVRVRIGVSPTTPTGKLRKPAGEDKVVRFLLTPMKEDDRKVFKKILKKASEVITMLIEEGRAKTMNRFNS